MAASNFPVSLLALHSQQPQAPQQAPQPQSQSKTPDGTPASYMGPDQGPFECDNCEHFDGAGHCNQPEVVQELGDSDGQGLADVDPKGCCNFFEKGQGQAANSGAPSGR